MPDPGEAGSAKSRSHAIDDVRLRVGVQIGVHRQADHLLGQTLGDRQATVGDREMTVRRLPVQRFGIVDRRRDTIALELGSKGVAPPVLDHDGVLSLDRARPLDHARHAHDVLQSLFVAPGDLLPSGDLVRENRELLEQNGRL